MYADDVTLVEPVEDPVVSTMALNSDLAAIASWANQWLLHFNAAKCKSIIFSVKVKKFTIHHCSSTRKFWKTCHLNTLVLH